MKNTAGKEGFVLLAGLVIGAILAAGWLLAGWAGVGIILVHWVIIAGVVYYYERKGEK